jgi:GxxExxY protein
MDAIETPINELTGRIIGAAIEVHTALGPGLLESVYHECLDIELKHVGLSVERDRHVPLHYRGQRIHSHLKLDLIVEGRVIVEVKAVERFHPIYQAQVITYLKLTGCPAGLLLNFNMMALRAGVKRIDHPDLYVKKESS